MNGQQVKEFLGNNGSPPEGILYMPRSLGYGAKLNRSTPEEIHNDAGMFLKGLKKEEELLRPDLLVLNYDSTYLAEMSGCQVQMKEPFTQEVVSGSLVGRETEWAEFCLPVLAESGRMPIYLEVLAIMKRSTRTPVIGMVPTPFTLCRQLAGDSFLQKCLQADEKWEDLMDAALYVAIDTVKLFLDRGSDGILFFEDFTGFEEGKGSSLPVLLKDYYRTIYNILKHYQKRAIFCIHGKQAAALEVYVHDQVAGVCLCDQDPEEIVMTGFEQGRPVPGSGLNREIWNEDNDFEQKIDRYLDPINSFRSFIFSPLISADARPEGVLSLVREAHARKSSLRNG